MGFFPMNNRRKFQSDQLKSINWKWMSFAVFQWYCQHYWKVKIVSSRNKWFALNYWTWTNQYDQRFVKWMAHDYHVVAYAGVEVPIHRASSTFSGSLCLNLLAWRNFPIRSGRIPFDMLPDNPDLMRADRMRHSLCASNQPTIEKIIGHDHKGDHHLGQGSFSFHRGHLTGKKHFILFML